MLHQQLFSRLAAPAAALALMVIALPAAPVGAVPATSDTLVTTGSPGSPFPQNKQNEPGIARDPISGTLIAGSNDELDLGPCTDGSSGGTCPFTPGVGISGVYFSFDNGASWTQPTYTGWSARGGTPEVGPIGTLPNYYEAGLISQGDPILAVGPKPGPNGFKWSNGSRYYYANLTENFPGDSALTTPFVAVAVSHTDNPTAAAAGDNSAWSAPSIASGRLDPVLFDDKNSLWADNAASSPFFGRVYAAWTAFRAQSSDSSNAAPAPIMIAHSDNGGVTWSNPVQVSAASNNGRLGGRQGSTIRTDSHGVVYLFFEGATPQLGSVQMMSRSFNGGATFETPQPVARVNNVGVFDPVQGRFTFDGVAGARTNSYPSLDIANAAPTGDQPLKPATNLIVLGWSDAGQPNPFPGTLGGEVSYVQTSSNGGNTWSAKTRASDTNDRPDFTAVAVAPNGSSVYVVYDRFTTNVGAYANDPRSGARDMAGVVRGSSASSLSFSDLHRGASGDARGSSANGLTSEFIGDYNYAVASNTGVTAVWNDVRNADDCQAVDNFRAALAGLPAATANPTGADFGEDDAASAVAATGVARPYPPTDCGRKSTFGNSDIFGYVQPLTRR